MHAHQVTATAEPARIPMQGELISDVAIGLAVGEYLERPYGEAKSLIYALRKLKDGRVWSLHNLGTGNYIVWRLA